MVTVAEALQQTSQAEDVASQRQQEIKKAEQAAKRIKVGGTAAEQIRFGPGFAQARRDARQQKQKALQDIATAKEELGTFKSSITERKQQIAGVQAQQAKTSKFNRDLALAQKIVGRGQSAVGQPSSVVKLVQRIRGRGGASGKTSISQIPQGAIGTALGGGFLFSESELARQSLPDSKIVAIEPVGTAQEGGLLVQRKFAELDKLPAISQPSQTGFQTIKQTVSRTPLSFLIGKSALGGRLTSEFISTPQFASAASGGPVRQLGFERFVPGAEQRQRSSEESIGLVSRFTARQLPKTRGEVILTAVAAPAIEFVPTFVQRGALGLTGIQSGRQLFDKDLGLEEKVFSGVEAIGLTGGAVALPGKFQTGVRQQKAQLSALKQRGIITESTAENLLQGIKLQKFLRAAPDVPVKFPAVSAIDPQLTRLERQAFTDVILSPEKGTIFGSQATRLRGLQGPGGDIDIAFRNNEAVLNQLRSQLGKVSTRGAVVRGEAIGVKGLDKGFDIKALSRTEAFPFSQKPVKTPEGVRITRLSEQFSRTLSGTLELRKGGKDIGSAIISARGLVGESAARLQGTRLPGLRQFRQFGQARAERRLSSFERAVPEIGRIVERTGQAEIASFQGRFIPSTEFPTVKDLFPQGRSGRVGGIKSLSSDITKLDIRVARSITPRGARTFRSASSFESSIIKPSTLGSTRAPFGSAFAPSRLPKASAITPSSFIPKASSFSIQPTRSSQFTSKPSKFTAPVSSSFFAGTTSTIGSNVIGSPSILAPSSFRSSEFFSTSRDRSESERRRKKTKSKRGKRKIPRFSIAPSFTAIATEQFGTLPKSFKIAGRDVGILPTSIRLQPIRSRTRRNSLSAF